MHSSFNGPFDPANPEQLARGEQYEQHKRDEQKKRAARRRGKSGPQPDAQCSPAEPPAEAQMDESLPEFDPIHASILERLKTTKNGTPTGSASNYAYVFELDPHFAGLRYNVYGHRYENIEDGKVSVWTDADSAQAYIWISRNYDFENKKAFDEAFKALEKRRPYHPLQELIKSLTWDGSPRIEEFLAKWTGAPDTAYTREVSRLLFSGGIHRCFNPGCKFDEVVVLTGAQGSGKSTLVRWLAMRDEYFAELLTVNGKEGAEVLEGKWVLEMSELLAMRTAKATEAVKSFLSRLIDVYRPAYGHFVGNFKRTCIIIGTSNHTNFIADTTGGRRFYPVPMTVNADWLYEHEAECKYDIEQCWAEAYLCYSSSDPAIKARVQAHPFKELHGVIKEQQEQAREDDPRIGLIQDWLNSDVAPDVTCVLEVYRCALDQVGPNGSAAIPSDKERREIAAILDQCEGWERGKSTRRIKGYGPQRYWQRRER